MFRLRRYRIFLAFAVFVVLALYKLGTVNPAWREQATSFAQSHRGNAAPQVKWEPKPQVAKETKQFEVEVPAAKNPVPKETPPPIASVARPVKKTSTAPGRKSIPSEVGVAHVGGGNAAHAGALSTVVLGDLPFSSIEPIHWIKTKEQYPVPTESLIALPTAKPKPIPKIQADFKKETDAEKADRESKLGTIKDVFKRSWSGYKEFAWLHDEVMPVTGSNKDPFAGWGATLVDALDTLWIMGLKDEFEEAVKAVAKIDFTTTSRVDIPLFETTIRYLGGFLAAYDMAGKKHEILLTKAKELAEILMAAFDTPNRMPQTYYYWQPLSSSSPLASNRVVLAEIGSLTMEFTYLAQLTGEDRFYDAVARITDNLEGYQNYTMLPGMWPTYLDASGCLQHNHQAQSNKSPHKPITPEDSEWEEALKNGAYLKADPSQPLVMPAQEGSAETAGEIPLKLPPPLEITPNGVDPNWKPEPEEPLVWPGPPSKRQLAAAGSPVNSEASQIPLKLVCDNPGFGPSSSGGREEYTLGGMSDSTYEYLPKQYLLLGGQVEKYRTMYETSAEVMKKHLVFRPMLPNEDDILFSGKRHVFGATLDETPVTELEPEYAHLTCFAGGMFGMSAKIFDRSKDLKIAAKLTEGCVWSYNMTATGIMPEAFHGVACESRNDCPWNQTLYHELLDPAHENRAKQYEQAMINYEINVKSASLWYESAMQAYRETPALTPVHVGNGIARSEAEPTAAAGSVLDKRQLTDLIYDAAAAQDASLSVGRETADDANSPTKVQPEVAEEEEPIPSRVMPTFPAIWSPSVPLGHKEYVTQRIKEERLPIGVTRIKAREYILRPEAIESVWYMYRITGDPYWRAAGWRMFEAIERHTVTTYGNSAIDDVTKTSPNLNDSMESFWLAETLKYFYLLFSEPGVVSLDEWVLNTEAHPFRRPT